MWLYEIKTEDPVILTGPFTVRYPMKNDPDLRVVGYACHEGNTIVPNYTNTSRHERANPPKEPVVPALELAQVPQAPPGGLAGGTATQAVRCARRHPKALAGRWVGRPQIKTIDYDIEIEFTANPDGTVVGRLIRTTLPQEQSDQPVVQKFPDERQPADELDVPEHAGVELYRRAVGGWHRHRRHDEQRPGWNSADVQEAVEDTSQAQRPAISGSWLLTPGGSRGAGPRTTSGGTGRLKT